MAAVEIAQISWWFDDLMIWYDSSSCKADSQLIYFLFPIGLYCRWDKHGYGLYLIFFLQQLSCLLSVFLEVFSFSQRILEVLVKRWFGSVVSPNCSIYHLYTRYILPSRGWHNPYHQDTRTGRIHGNIPQHILMGFGVQGGRVPKCLKLPRNKWKLAASCPMFFWFPKRRRWLNKRNAWGVGAGVIQWDPFFWGGHSNLIIHVV